MGKRISLEEAIDILQANNQPNLLKDFESFSAGQRVNILHQIASMDWKNVEMVRRGKETLDLKNIIPPDALEYQDIELNRSDYEKRGRFLLRTGKVAAVMLAGDSGTGQGFAGPRGEINIGKSKSLYIYQCLIENLLFVTNEIKAIVPLYIMTNAQTRERTERFFKSNNYFGYPKELVTFFSQGNSICVDLNGNLFFESFGKLSSYPNGNGGWFSSMEEANLLIDLDKRGVEWINVFSVDNVLQRIADPVFIGAVTSDNYDSGAKVVRKNGIFEKVGLFCKIGDKSAVFEHYEIDDITKSKKDVDGELTYRYGVTLNYLFNVKKLKQIHEEKFPVHMTKKKLPFMNEKGQTVIPTEPNGYRFETLSGDIVAMMDNCLCFEILRYKEFAPVKNAAGEDSVESARKLLMENGVKI